MKKRIDGGVVRGDAAARDRRALDRLIEELHVLRESMIEFESRLLPRMDALEAAGQASARNLAHFLATRSFDLRGVQARLTAIGVSSLGGAEPQVLASLDKVVGILHMLAGREGVWPGCLASPPLEASSLEHRAEALFGASAGDSRTRIMVTLPGSAAFDDALVEGLVRSGMNVARIDCAHDTADAWVAMAARVRQAAAANGRSVKVLMDLAGPKLRTGPIAPGPAVLKLKPARDAVGAVVAPVRLGLRVAGSRAAVPGATEHVGVDPAWLAALEIADLIDLVDARASARRLAVLARCDEGVLVETLRTVYLTPETRLRLRRRGDDVLETGVADLPAPEGRLHLRRGDTLRLLRKGVGHDASDGSARKRVAVASIACTLPEALAPLRKGERVWFDDGRIGGVVRHVGAKGVEVEITDAAEEGARLGADKGINLPDTRLELPALSAKDIEDLAVVARHADIVGLSFAQGADDVKLLRRQLRRLDAQHLGIVLKVETRRGFEQLPQMLFAAMACKAAGVMIARGDLAVECGFERLAEVQDEILRACEAAHMPVVWAIHVLESPAKTGLASRAEITDAAMGVRAECVMLNKGPHILDALRTLDDILRRMQAHQSSKRPLLRALKAWNGAGGDEHAAGGVR
jgi:pyruvate kinase